MPPSSATGGGYWWFSEPMGERLLAGEVPELPEKLRALLEEPERVMRQPGDMRGSGASWAVAALRDEVAGVAAAPPGSRNDRLNRAAFKLGQIVADGHCERSLVEGELRAAAVAAGLGVQEAEATIRSGIAAGLKEPRGPKAATSASREDGVRTVGASAAMDRAWPAPDLTLLEPERELPPVLPVQAIVGPEWGAWLERAAEGKGAPVDYVAGALVAVAGSLIGNARWARPYGDWKEPPIFWVMLVGNPSARKSPALDAVRAPLQTLADRLQSEAEPAHKRWLEAKEQADVHLMAWREKAKQAAKKGNALPSRPPAADAGEEPHMPKLEVNDATVEGLTKILARQARGTLVVRDELAGWLGGMNRYNTGNSDRPFWIEAFGGRRYAVDRVSKDRLVVHRLTVSLVGAIQPEPLTSLLLKPDDDGLVARFCPFWPLLSPPKRPSTSIDPRFAVNAFGRLLSLEMGEDEEGEPAPIFLPFSGAAQEQLDKFIIEVSRLEKEAEGEGLLVSFIGKLPGTAVRFALLLSFLDWTVSRHSSPPNEVSAACVERAIRFATAYLVPMARRTYAAAAGNPAERSARRLLKLIMEEKPADLSVREIYRRKLSGLKSPGDDKAALNILEGSGIVRRQERVTGGRSQQLFVCNPLIWEA